MFFNPITGKPRVTLQKLAETTGAAGKHPAAINMKTIAVAQDAEGKLFATSSSYFNAAMKAKAIELAIEMISKVTIKHAVEHLLSCLNNLVSAGAFKRDPLGTYEHNCAKN